MPHGHMLLPAFWRMVEDTLQQSGVQLRTFIQAFETVTPSPLLQVGAGNQSHYGWKRPLRSPGPTTNPSPPCPLTMSLGATSPRFLDTSRDGDCTTSLGSCAKGMADSEEELCLRPRGAGCRGEVGSHSSTGDPRSHSAAPEEAVWE